MIVVLSLGCENKPLPQAPKTHAATGTLRDRAGNPVTNGALEFSSATTRAIVEVKPDGTFELVTRDIDGNAFPGIEAGTYSVNYLPFSSTEPLPPVKLSKQTIIKANEPNLLELLLP